MSRSIEFDMRGVMKTLDALEKVYLPEAGRQALKSFGFEARKLLQDEMRDKYQAVTPFTERSPIFKQEGLSLTIGISNRANGVPPRNYLAPTDRTGGVRSKQLQPTSFAGALRARYGIDEVPVPVRSSRAGSQFIDKRGNVKGRKVQSLLDALNNPGSGREDYFVIKPGQSQRLSGGVYRRYRVKSANISAVFALVDKPTQATVLDFHGVLEEAARTRLPALIQKKLDRILG